MVNPRLKELAALLMIGDGLLAVLYPKRYLQLWEIGPQPLKATVHEMSEHPLFTRFVGALEAGLGLWYARRQMPS